MRPNGFTGFGQLLLIVALTSVAFSASGAMVALSNVSDGNGTPAFFDPASNAQSGAFGEIITVGLGTGLGAFKADGSSAVPFATDTLFMTITAPAGHLINLITYSETGTGTTGATGFATATGSMVVDGTPINFLTQMFGPSTSSGWSILPTPTPIANKSSIDLSISNSLVAFLFGPGTATIEKTGAVITVGLTAIPIPPAIWMMGAALSALITVGRRQAT